MIVTVLVHMVVIVVIAVTVVIVAIVRCRKPLTGKGAPKDFRIGFCDQASEGAWPRESQGSHVAMRPGGWSVDIR